MILCRPLSGPGYNAPMANRRGRHGGARPGAGRPTTLDDAKPRNYVLELAQVEKIRQYQAAHGLDNASQALRELIEQAELDEQELEEG